MNIKSLLLGSAAALVAVSGARAADAVVFAEPEPMDYVRICDTYGTGYYYIPGTETCLSLSGYVRYQISFDDDDDGWRKHAKGVLDINAKSETEFGTLTGFISFVGTTEDTFEDDGAAVGYMYMEYATITLGGLSMGVSDSIYDVDVGGEFDDSGLNNDNTRVHFINYTFAGANGFSATVALEEEDYNENYIPNVVARVGFTQGWGSVDVFGTYDDDDDNVGQEDAFTLKGVATINASEMIAVRVMGIWESDLGFYSTDYEWSVAAMIEAAVSEKVSVGFGGQYFGDSWFGDGDGYSVGGEVGYKITEGFATKLQVQYDQRDTDGVLGDDEDSINGWLRFERSF